MKTGIYLIQSTAKPHRIYIGSAVNIERRWKDHSMRLIKGTHENIKLQNHFFKYGQDDLKFGLLTECNKSELMKLEQEYIDQFNPHFNICRTAGSSIGCKNPVNAAKKGEKNPFFKKHHTKVSKALMSKNRRGKGLHDAKWKEEQSKRMQGENHPQFGKKHSEDRLKIDSAAQMGKIVTAETKNNMSNSAKEAWRLRKLKT